MNMNIDEIIKMVQETPNDTKLGKKIRNYVSENTYQGCLKIIIDLIEMVQETPNDMTLGSKIRWYIQENIQSTYQNPAQMKLDFDTTEPNESTEDEEKGFDMKELGGNLRK